MDRPPDKPSTATVRWYNHLSDVLSASREAGIPDEALLAAIRRQLLAPFDRDKPMPSQAVQKRGGGPATPTPIPDSILELVVATGDLSKLSARERMSYYAMRCEAAGLDPRTCPFQYVTFRDGKLQLYATKDATNQLIARRHLNVKIVERKLSKEFGIFSVTARVKAPDGAEVDDCADVDVAGLRGTDLCNQLMKCVTKAKRRCVLSACGLGELDELEIETVPDARKSVADLPMAPPPAPRAVGPPPAARGGRGDDDKKGDEGTRDEDKDDWDDGRE